MKHSFCETTNYARTAGRYLNYVLSLICCKSLIHLLYYSMVEQHLKVHLFCNQPSVTLLFLFFNVIIFNFLCRSYLSDVIAIQPKLFDRLTAQIYADYCLIQYRHVQYIHKKLTNMQKQFYLVFIYLTAV